MEPRIATLLGISCQRRTSHDPMSLVAPSSSTRESRPAEPTSAGEDALMVASTFSSDYNAKPQIQGHISLARPKPGAPIAQVLNNEAPMLHTPQPTSPTTPFVGRHDHLLDDSEQVNKRRKREQHCIQTALGGCENPVIKLPELPQLPRRTAKRPRIPPLLQGLHQPPPLPPEGRLFPPITGEKNAFVSNPGEGVGLDIYAEETRSKVDDEHVDPGIGVIGMSREARKEESTGEQHAATKLMPPTLALDLEKTNKLRNRGPLAEASSQSKRARKRKWWSEQETKDLLVGVSRFGIGNWKKILQDPEFEFKGRTAVDWDSANCAAIKVKDRFRVCCPGEGLKLRKTKQSKANPEKHPDTSAMTIQIPNDSTTIGCDGVYSDVMMAGQRSADQQQGLIHANALAKLPELGIHLPFMKSTRRPRRRFSAYDDKNLLKGFEKYGTVWHSMRDDTELGFSTRHPTDLRDRFRIKYPEQYAMAGYKLKPEQERTINERTSKRHGQEHWERLHSTGNAAYVPNGGGIEPQPNVDSRRVPGKRNLTSTATSCLQTSSNPSLKSFGLEQYLSDPLPTLLGDWSVSEDGDGEESPITLNRNILRWADANPSSLFTIPPTPTTTHGANHVTGDTPIHAFVASDGIHINPLATLKLPPTTFYANTLPIVNARPCNTSSSLFHQSTITSGAVSNGPGDTRMVPTASAAANSTSCPVSPAIFSFVPPSDVESSHYRFPSCSSRQR
ncbi:uncharacterized protein K460DRAFT_291478 [Cucurbitaria berberidis CBS 394.84]|uniref:ATP-dependent helicase CHD1-2/hrp3 HTH domain-containing protein n=1 Tax=Cucurbitaria berberidis CBS 394.84 TaxID=1168544 RepID=A0A9P4G944_9PLEO|nr:uncharacterized protein K460DRAFT_291478 [Cucurbitaria berberidis CBS 394.84]KAF1841408.1 hypothetical protein K460DRAFT_291478 [Cucurbitaria berberidis CBS 394.84]